MEHEADTQSVSAGAAEDGGRVRVVGASDSAEPKFNWQSWLNERLPRIRSEIEQIMAEGEAR